jgi:hypothetical protein
MMEQVFNFIVKAVAKKAAKAAVKKGIDIIDDALKNKGTEGVFADPTNPIPIIKEVLYPRNKLGCN